MGTLCKSIAVIWIVAIGFKIPVALSESREKTCSLTCADVATVLLAQAAETQQPHSTKSSPQSVIQNLSDFIRSCNGLCNGGIFTADALRNYAGFAPRVSTTTSTSTVATTSPSPAPTAAPPPPQPSTPSSGSSQWKIRP